MKKRKETNFIILHTTAVLGDYGIDPIRDYHVEERGYDDVGYHYFITKDGTVQKGLGESLVGMHCRHQGMNFRSLGICFAGHHDKEEWTQNQHVAFLRLTRRLMDKYDVPSRHILGHRETGSPKTCPGNKVDMDYLRRGASEYLDRYTEGTSDLLTLRNLGVIDVDAPDTKTIS